MANRLKFLISLLTVISTLSFGEAVSASSFPFMLSCVTSPTVTFSTILKREATHVSFQYNNARHETTAPVYYGQVLSDQMSTIETYKEVAEKIGKGFIVQFPLKNCTYQEGFVFRCEDYEAKPEDINGHKIAVYSMFSDVHLSRSFAGEFTNVIVTANMNVDGRDFLLRINYDSEFCSKLDND